MSLSLVGVSPILWSNDDLPELGGDTPLERCLSEARRCGYDGIELGHKFPRDPARLASVLREHHLMLTSGWFGTRLLSSSVEQEVARMEPLLSLLEQVECGMVVAAEITGSVHRERAIPVSKRPLLHPEGLKLFGESLTLLADALRTRGFRLSYHHHMGTVIESEEDVDALVAQTGPAVGLTIDTGHALFAGFDPRRIVERHGARVTHVHLKEVRAATLQASESSFLDAVVDGVFTVPGDGSYDFPAFLAGLAAVDYQGWLIVEADQDPERADPHVYASMGRNSLRRWLSHEGG